MFHRHRRSCSTGSKSAPGRWWERALSARRDGSPPRVARGRITGQSGSPGDEKARRGSTGSGGTTSSRRSAIEPGSLPSYPPVPRPADSSERASRSVGKRFIDPAHRMARLRESTGASIGPGAVESMRSKASQVSGRCGVPSPVPPQCGVKEEVMRRRMHASSSCLSPH